MYILDTDHLSLIQRNGQEGKRILAKLATIEAPVEVAVTVITYEEQVRGRLKQFKIQNLKFKIGKVIDSKGFSIWIHAI